MSPIANMPNSRSTLADENLVASFSNTYALDVTPITSQLHESAFFSNGCELFTNITGV
jgi:hypothetical protein